MGAGLSLGRAGLPRTPALGLGRGVLHAVLLGLRPPPPPSTQGAALSLASLPPGTGLRVEPTGGSPPVLSALWPGHLGLALDLSRTILTPERQLQRHHPRQAQRGARPPPPPHPAASPSPPHGLPPTRPPCLSRAAGVTSLLGANSLGSKGVFWGC